MNFGTNKESCHDKLGIHHLEITEEDPVIPLSYGVTMNWKCPAEYNDRSVILRLIKKCLLKGTMELL